MNEKFLDHNLKVDKSMYETVCVPIRIVLGLLFITNTIPKALLPVIAILLLVTCIGLGYKNKISENSWKNYMRAIITYMIIIFLIIIKGDDKNVNIAIGILLITDALAGIQTKHIFTKLSS
jgi:hypothetical protein